MHIRGCKSDHLTSGNRKGRCISGSSATAGRGSLNAMGAHELARQRENEGRAKVPAAVQKNEKPKFPLPERKIARVALIGVPI